jgi:hypothetical protein
MNKLGIIVDGDGDYSSFEARFKGKCRILKTDGPRGQQAKIGDIVKNSKKQINMLCAFRCNRVIIVMDFEDRNIPYQKFVSVLREQFGQVAFGIPVLVAVPNKMLENWYLADIEEISSKRIFIKKGLHQKNYEGKHGKAEIKKCMAKGITYSETNHGPQMFSVIRFDVACKHSPSFKEFLSMMNV